MRQELVSIDLETTGLSVENDAIIEIGAVRIRDNQVVEEFSTLINPSFAISEEVTHITGIHQEDLRGAPSLKDMLPALVQFVGDAPVIAHNVQFDIGFLRRFGTLHNNQTLDTVEIASIMLPRVPRYNLGSLASHFNIELEQAHRALDDARATALLYIKLWEHACNLPTSLLNELSQLGDALKWELSPFFASVALASKDNGVKEQRFTRYEGTITEPKSERTFIPIDKSSITDFLGENGQLAQMLPHFEHRDEQITLSSQIVEAFNAPHHLIAEAGTGTGKSLAYLLPAVLWATTNNQRVTIATHTINLQDQLMNKDVPTLQDALDVPFSASVMKGRSNYLCPRRLEAIRRRKPSNLDELRTLAKVLIWLQESQSGDKSEISLRGNEYAIWNRLSAEDEGCSTHQCETSMRGVCPFYKARLKAEESHVVIANHALLISDALSNNRVLPEYKYLVVDEAHQLEEAITSGLSVRIDQTSLLRRIQEMGGVSSGILGDLLNNLRGHISDKQVMRLEAFIQNIGDASQDMSAVVRVFFSTVNQFVTNTGTLGTANTRIADDQRKSGGFARIQEKLKRLDEYFEVMVEALKDLVTLLSKLDASSIPSFEDHINSTSSSALFFTQAREVLQEFAFSPDASRVYWIETHASPDFTGVQSAPLHIGQLMDTYLWSAKDSVVLTSATLQTNKGFQFLKDRLDAQNVPSITVGSPFDYKKSTLLYLPDDIPEPNRTGYQTAVEKGIIELAAALEGRVMVLFTSYSQLRETAASVTPRLALGGITVYDQITGLSREALLDGFRTTHKAVLLGTKSFWQGVDIAGDDLQGIIIVRLPFAVPNDPVFASRSETYENGFDDYGIPDAILRFRQGFGRLIRTHQDKGIVAVFDSRIIHRGYGKAFIASLPECTVMRGSTGKMAIAAKNWLNPS